MKIIKKTRYSNGRRHIYLLGVKVFSYKKKMKKGTPQRSFLYRFFTYPLAVYDEYKRLKKELQQ